MWPRFFTILVVTGDRQKELAKLKINIFVLIALVALLLATFYYIGLMYYEVFFVKKSLVSIDKITAENQSQINKIDSLKREMIDDYIKLNYLETAKNSLINGATPNYTQKTKLLSENEVLKQANKDGLLSVIDDPNTKNATNSNIVAFFDYIKRPVNIKTNIPKMRPTNGIVVGEVGAPGRQFFDIDDTIQGVVLSTKSQEAVYAVADGIVTDQNFSEIYGDYIEIYHSFGLVSRYFNIVDSNLKIGERVALGQNIAKVATRNNSNYLYFQIIYYGIPQNPLIYF